MSNARMQQGVLSVLTALLLLSCTEVREETPLARAVDFLWAQQGEDGGWHSTTHGILKGGISLTPFIAWHLLQVDGPARADYEKASTAALDFIRRSLSDTANGTPLVLDYPNYSAAYALRVLHHFGEEHDSNFVAALRDYLAGQQFAEGRGISPDHPAYGGWGFGETNLTHGHAGHVDISHTRRVLEALADVLPPGHAVFRVARGYLDRHQNLHPEMVHASASDGGFFTSIHTSGTNKSVQYSTDPPRWESYATATADGLLARLAAGASPGDVEVHHALGWLVTHDNLAYPEGIPLDDPGQWHRVMRYYHLAVRAEALVATGQPGQWRDDIAEILAIEQLPDGSFVNPDGAPNKEDDPLLATTLAVIALNLSGAP